MDEKTIESLLQDAAQISRNAYAPYSNFPVGCAIVLEDGRRFLGVNIENASYPVAICAERVALAPIVTAGLQNTIKAVVVVTGSKTPGTPCGMCRQFLSEFLARDTPIIFGNTKGNYKISSIAELLPLAFDKSFLEDKGESLGA